MAEKKGTRTGAASKAADTASDRRGGKSSKTAHVLSLLSTGAPTPAREPAERPIQEPPVTKRPDDNAIEAQLRDVLAQALAGLDTAPAQPAEEPAAALPQEPKAPAPKPEAAPAPPMARQAPPTAVPKPFVVPDFSAPEEVQVPIEPQEPEETLEMLPDIPGDVDVSAIKPPEEAIAIAQEVLSAVPLENHPELQRPQRVSCINIMQILVEAKTDKYMKMFGLCRCPRCRADVAAIALNNLQPKYVVERGENLPPILGMFEAPSNAAVVAQVMSACKKVLEHPRHTAEDLSQIQ